jgi:hypothetical protein
MPTSRRRSGTSGCQRISKTVGGGEGYRQRLELVDAAEISSNEAGNRIYRRLTLFWAI